VGGYRVTEFTLAGNPNYAARIIEVKNLVTLDGLDNLVGIPIDGFQALVSNEVQVGDILVIFPAESQIEEWFLSKFNLFRHAEKNWNTTTSGYIEDNRRVRAVKLRGHQSNALALDAAYVGATKADVGTLFDTVDGTLISKKYELPLKGSPAQKGQRTSTFAKISFPEHLDTENYWRNSDKIGPDEFVTVTQKLHGTSVRYGNVLVPKVLSRWQRVLRWFGADVNDEEYAFVAGSRKVIKSVVRDSSAQTNDKADHFYATDLWSDYAEQHGIADLIPEGAIVFGELVGWTPAGAPIQQNYTYNVPKGEAHLYIYRVATITPDGKLYDLSWNGVKQFAFERGLNVVPEIWAGFHHDFAVGAYIDKRFADEYGYFIPGLVPLSDKKTVDEGVVVRKEGILPYVLKAKSPIFLGHESKLLDAEVIDLESEESHGLR
jgi:hypothetical protein